MKIGIDLGGSHIGIGVVNEEGRIVEKLEKRLMSKEKKEILKTLESYLIKNIKEFQEKYKITEIGIAIPGTVTTTEIVKAVNLGIDNYPIVDVLQKEINLPILLKNDAKAAALAEAKYGALKDYQRVLFLTLGTGIGGAVTIQNKLLDCGELPGCEFGHMVLEKQGIPCNCGKKGCFEKYASMKALKNNLRTELGLDEKTRGEELLEILRTKGEEPNLKRIVDEFIEYLSIGISNLIAVFEPEAIGIGGSFVYFEDILLERLQNNIQKKYLFNQRKNLRIIPAVLGNDAGMIGSVL